MMQNTDTPTTIQINSLTKVFDNTPAVYNLNLNIQKAEIFGFLGPNGAGKTTTIKAMLGLVFSNYGNVTINGYDVLKYPKYIKKYVGYMPEKTAFYDNLTALQNLSFYAELKNVSKDECIRLISELGLWEHANKKVGKYSKGMLQRLGMARAMLGRPPIMILDEPTGGLDPRGVRLIRDKIKEMHNNGTTIFLSSHILSEVQAVCTQVGIINRGVLVAQDTPDNLSKNLMIQPKMLLEVENLTDKILDHVKNISGVNKVDLKDDTLEVFCAPNIRADVIIGIHKKGGKILNIQTQEASLEDVFIKLTEDVS